MRDAKKLKDAQAVDSNVGYFERNSTQVHDAVTMAMKGQFRRLGWSDPGSTCEFLKWGVVQLRDHDNRKGTVELRVVLGKLVWPVRVLDLASNVEDLFLKGVIPSRPESLGFEAVMVYHRDSDIRYTGALKTMGRYVWFSRARWEIARSVEEKLMEGGQG